MDTQKIRELAQIMRDYGIARMDISEGGERVLLECGTAVSGTSAPVLPSGNAAGEQVLPAVNESGTVVKAPLVGTVYLRPKPDEAPFVEVGSEVKAGDVLCTVEAMKMFNEITAPHDGIVKSVAVKNAQAVGYGEKLFVIEKV